MDDDEIENPWSSPSVSNKPITPKPSPALVVNNKDKQPYSAFEPKDKPIGFVVRGHAIHYTFFYHHLLTVALNSPEDDFFILLTNNAAIQVYGRNLQTVAAAFGMHECAAISEYSPELFLPPSDDSQPFIEKIEVRLATPAKKPERETKAEEKRERQET